MKLPKPKLKVGRIDANNKHTYTVEEYGEITKYPGVTGILGIISKPALVPWATKMALDSVDTALMQHVTEKVEITPGWIQGVISEAKRRPDKIKTDAGTLGTAVHEVVDEIVWGRKVVVSDLPKPIQGPVLAFLEWKEQAGIEFVAGDTKVASVQYGYGGSLDALGYSKKLGKYIILDWKTSKNIYKEYALQVAAYAHAFYETYGIHASEACIVRFGKVEPIDFGFEWLEDVDKSFETFLFAKSLKDHLKIPAFRPKERVNVNGEERQQAGDGRKKSPRKKGVVGRKGR